MIVSFFFLLSENRMFSGQLQIAVVFEGRVAGCRKLLPFHHTESQNVMQVSLLTRRFLPGTMKSSSSALSVNWRPVRNGRSHCDGCRRVSQDLCSSRLALQMSHETCVEKERCPSLYSEGWTMGYRQIIKRYPIH